MADYNEVVGNIGRGFKDLGGAVYDITGTALTNTGDALYHFSQRRVDLRDILSSKITRLVAIGAMVWLAYSSCAGSCVGHSKPVHNENVKIIQLEKKVNDLEAALKANRSCLALSHDHPSYVFDANIGKQ